MEKEKKTKKIYILFFGIVMAVAVLFSMPTFAWMVATFSTNITVTGNVVGSYFEQGDGSSQTPYVIVKPIQLYYFAWLQNIGQFDGVNSLSDDGKFHFTLGADIDMSGNEDFATLPPIGTSTYPFKGVFDGKYHFNPKDGNADPLDPNNTLEGSYHTISNLTIDNANLTNIPTGGTQGMQYVGLFGVVGSMTDSSVVGEIKNFGLQDVTIATNGPLNDKTIVGIVAGYCNGNLSGIGVSGCKINVGKSGLTPASINGSTPDTLSFGLVGYSDKTYEAYGISPISGGSSFGGSLSMSDLFTRISDAQDVNNGAYYSTYYLNKTVVMDVNGQETITYSNPVEYEFNNSSTSYKLTNLEVKDDQNKVMQSYGSLVKAYDGNIVVYLAGAVEKTLSQMQTVTTSGYHYYYYIKNGDGQYMARSGSNITNLSASTDLTVQENLDAVSWKFEAESGYGKISCGNYYLFNNNGQLQLKENTGTTWNTSNGTITNGDYRLCFSGGVWTLKVQTSYYTIDSNNGNSSMFMNISGSSVAANSNSTTEWYTEAISGSSYVHIYGLVGNTKYYLYKDGTSLKLRANSPVTSGTNRNYYRWFFTQVGGFIRNVKDPKYYIVYDGTWKATYYDDYPRQSVRIDYVTRDLGTTTISQSAHDLWQSDPIQTKADVTVSTVETFIPITINDDGSVSSKNTGYIVGGTNNNDVNNYPGNSYIDCVSTSGNLTSSLNGNSYTSGKMEILTRTSKTNGAYCRIEDTYNVNNQSVSSNISGYTKKSLSTLGLNSTVYTNAREQLDTTLSASQNVYGLCFKSTAISDDNKALIPHAYINGSHLTNYYVPRNCIDFNLSKRGFINFFAATLKNSTSFFSLHQIQRNGDTIVVKEIRKIYRHKTDDTAAYIYEYSDSTTTGTVTSDYEELFDMAWITDTNEINALQKAMYYFEIPLNAGEYALGSVLNGSGSHLIYLDIGTSATSLDDGTTLETSITGVNFVANGALTSQNRAATLDAITSDSIAAAVIVLKTGFLGEITFTRTDVNENTTITCTLSNESSEAFVVWTKRLDNTFVVVETETS